MQGYLAAQERDQCFGCETCVQACTQGAIQMKEDEEGFYYPSLDTRKCVSCKKCHLVCPSEYPPSKSEKPLLTFGGYHVTESIRRASTSGGAFSAIAESWCDTNYVIFGAVSQGLKVFHSYITDKSHLTYFRKSKYSQSTIGNSYAEAKKFLQKGKKVLFSGTPCQIAGLKNFLDHELQKNLLTIEVICEGVPSPLYMQKYNEHLQKKHGSTIKDLDYRDTDKNKWDFEVMSVTLQNGLSLKKDRWFNPFWSIWLKHLMSRPSCYKCPFTTTGRVADITLGDLWGVHLYCPELYGKNQGSSLILCNTQKGAQAFSLASQYLFGHELDFATASKYQSPLRKTIEENPQRSQFMADLRTLSYTRLCRKWAAKPSAHLLWSKYVWGNRQKVCIWNLTHTAKRKEKR